MKRPIKNNAEPLVSIITPLYNAEQYIASTIQSVQAQSYSNWEQIIVDDCSTDQSVAIVNKIAETDQRIKLHTLSRNKGAAYARNKATQMASGKYIAFLDADDLWSVEKLSKQIAFMQHHDCAVSYTSYIHIDEGGDLLGKRINALPQLTYKKQHSNNYLGNLTGMYDTSQIGKIKAPKIRKRQDWAVWLEAIKLSSKPALGIQEDLAMYRVRKDSISANKWNLVKYNYHFYKTYLGYSSPKAAICLLRFFWEYFLERPKYIETYNPNQKPSASR